MCYLIRFVHKKILFLLKKPNFAYKKIQCKKHFDSEKAAGVIYEWNNYTDCKRLTVLKSSIST